MSLVAAESRALRAVHQQQRFEAFEAWQEREQTTVESAREALDPQGFLYARAEQLVTEQRNEVNLAEVGPDPMTDLLGGARVVAAFAEAGHATEAARQNHHNDIRTAFTEALLKGGHVSEVQAELSADGEATIGNLRYWELFLRGAKKGNPQAAQAEIAEEFLAASLFHRPELREGHDLIIMSPSRPDTKGNTLMIRRFWFEQEASGRWLRHCQQLYMTDSHTGDLNQLLGELGLADEQSKLTEIEILSQPLLVRRDRLTNGVVDVGQMLDTIAAQRLDQPVFCGTPLEAEPTPQHYERLAEVSARREQAIGAHVDQVAAETLHLVQSQVLTYEEENQRFQEMFIAHLREICQDHPEYAVAAFGEAAASHYLASQQARQRGDLQTAEREIAEAHSLSTSVDICDTTISIATSGSGAKSEASPTDSLARKYGRDNLRRGPCLACQEGGPRQQLGPCGFCNTCDARDRLRPGYIKELIDQLQQPVAVESESMPRATVESVTEVRRLRHGTIYEIGDEPLEFRQQIVFGGTVPIFVSPNGHDITGEAAKRLQASLETAA